MIKLDNHIGEKIGVYEILDETDLRAKDGHKIYKVKCLVCGKIFYKQRSVLLHKRSCSHVKKYVDVDNFSCTSICCKNKKLRGILNKMISRCYNPDDKSYRFYGEKGIRVCNEWIEHPDLFESWAISNGYEEGLTIDRVESNKDYSPDNCRWVTLKYNAKWKSTTNTIKVDGIVDSGRGWSKRLGFGINYINSYIRKYGIEETKKFIKKTLDKQHRI